MLWFCCTSLCYNNFHTKIDTSNKIKCYRLTKNSELKQEYQRIFTQSIDQRYFAIVVRSCQMSFIHILRFLKMEKNVKTSKDSSKH